MIVTDHDNPSKRTVAVGHSQEKKRRLTQAHRHAISLDCDLPPEIDPAVPRNHWKDDRRYLDDCNTAYTGVYSSAGDCAYCLGGHRA